MPPASDKPLSERVGRALDKRGDFMSVDELCRAVFGIVGQRQRAAIYVVLHRMDGLEKRAAGWRRARRKKEA